MEKTEGRQKKETEQSEKRGEARQQKHTGRRCIRCRRESEEESMSRRDFEEEEEGEEEEERMEE